jgi:hypothetical protein
MLDKFVYNQLKKFQVTILSDGILVYVHLSALVINFLRLSAEGDDINPFHVIREIRMSLRSTIPFGRGL